jgi:hypothetical protein
MRQATSKPDAWPGNPRRGFALCREAVVVWYSMSFRCIGLACAISLMIMGCTHFTTADTPKTRAMWRAQLARQQLVARQAGRIGYVGNAGPTFGRPW